MTTEQIDLYRGVQKYQGEWQEQDEVVHVKYGHGVMSDPDHGSGLEAWFEKNGRTYLPKDDPDLLWIPPPTPRWPGDDVKRTLWGMVQWGKYDITVHHDGKVKNQPPDLTAGEF